MQNGHTCLILGAGASHPYWFPLGSELKEILCQSTIHHELGRTFDLKSELASRLSADHILDFQRRLAESPQGTIDRFLELQPKFDDIGKVAIALVIAFFEANCNFGERRSKAGDLYRLLYNAVFPDPRSPASKSIRIVSFNYDRSLERYLVRGLRADTQRDEAEALKEVERLGIIHVHGSVNANWPLKGDALDSAAKSIRILHQADAADATVQRLQNTILWSSRIVFLGFGYDEQNVALLRIVDGWPPDSLGRPFDHPAPPPAKVVYGTCLGLADAEIELARAQFHVACRIAEQYNQLDAYSFLRQTGLLACTDIN